MAQYLMVKYPKEIKSIEVKSAAPASLPYIPVKMEAKTGYLPLTTNTLGYGVFCKFGNKTYKVVSSYTTSTSSSSTYNSYYNTTSTSYYTITATTATKVINTFAEYLSVRADANGNYITRITETIQIVNPAANQFFIGAISYYRGGKTLYNTLNNNKFVSKSTTNVRIYYDLVASCNNNTFLISNYTDVNVTKTISSTLGIVQTYYTDYYSGQGNTTLTRITFRGSLLSFVEQAQQQTRPSAQYQTYSVATSNYTVSTIVGGDPTDLVIFDGTSLKVGYKSYASNFGNPDTATGPCASTPTLSISGGVLSCTYDFSSGSTYWKLGGIVLDPVDLTGYSKLQWSNNARSGTSSSSNTCGDISILDASRDLLTSRLYFIQKSQQELINAETDYLDISSYNFKAYIIIWGQAPSGTLTQNITSIKLLV